MKLYVVQYINPNTLCADKSDEVYIFADICSAKQKFENLYQSLKNIDEKCFIVDNKLKITDEVYGEFVYKDNDSTITCKIYDYDI